MRFAYCALRGPMSRLSRRLNAERLGNGGDLGALAFDRGGELLCSAATRRLRGRVELVVDGLVVGYRDDVGADAFAQFRRQRPASEQADIAVHFEFGETRFDAGWNVGQARCPSRPICASTVILPASRCGRRMAYEAE